MYVWKYDVIMYNVRIAILYYVEYFIIEYKVVCFEFVANLPRDDLERLHKLKTSWTAVNWNSFIIYSVDCEYEPGRINFP